MHEPVGFWRGGGFKFAPRLTQAGRGPKEYLTKVEESCLGRYASVCRADLCTLRLVKEAFALYTYCRVYYVDIAFGDCLYRALRLTYATCYTVFGNC